MALFPTKLKAQQVFKDAPFDVTESKLTDTFFTAWDGIKNNIILNWIDVVEASGNHGLAVLTDHTSSYVHGADHPPGLVLQYSGIGLWGRNYTIHGPTSVRYALVPHAGRWDKGAIPTESAQWNEPLVATWASSPFSLQAWPRIHVGDQWHRVGSDSINDQGQEPARQTVQCHRR